MVRLTDGARMIATQNFNKTVILISALVYSTALYSNAKQDGTMLDRHR